MAEDKRPQAVWEPGTLDATRKNIGEIGAEEAARMTKILGGEIMTEKSVPIDYSKLPKRAASTRVVRSTGNNVSSSKPAPSKTASSYASSSAKVATPKITKVENLPPISSKDNQKINKLMMSNMYSIKPNYGLFNFIKHFSKDGAERIIPEFAEITLKAHLEHVESFITGIKSMIQIAPDTYKSKIQSDMELKFRLIRKISEWSTRDIKLALVNLDTLKESPVVADLVPFVKAMYRQLITVFYLGEQSISKFIKEIYTDILHYPGTDKMRAGNLAKSCVTEWLYIYRRVAKGLYPLLLRMCGTPFVEFPVFFTSQISSILNFLGLKKFDLILPEKKPDGADVRKAKEAEDRSKAEEEARKKEQVQQEENLRNERIDTGLALLDKLFPGAGFRKLDTFPDMWPYFNPIYDFDEAFLLVAPENPVQISIVLCEILQDFFHACSKMKFAMETNPVLKSRDDTIIKALNEWPVYVDTLFVKDYGEPLKQLVNQTYSQQNYATTRVGKKTITDILWQTKYIFLPHFSFEQLLLERPLNSNKYLPLSLRTYFLKEAFEDFAKQIAKSEAARGVVAGLDNPWEHYDFELESPISKRMDVLLNAKERGPKMTATNANLIKYISCIIAVLDWWINDKNSPAYKASSKKIYRTMPGTNEPSFSVEARDDQDKLFASAIRAAVQKKAAK